MVESTAFGGAIQIESITLNDAVRSCDSDGILDNREHGQLVVKIRNTGWVPLALRARVTIDDPAISMPRGSQISFPTLQPYQSVTGTIEVALNGAAAFAPLAVALSINASDLAQPGPSLRATPSSSTTTSWTARPAKTRWMTRAQHGASLATASSTPVARGAMFAVAAAAPGRFPIRPWLPISGWLRRPSTLVAARLGSACAIATPSKPIASNVLRRRRDRDQHRRRHDVDRYRHGAQDKRLNATPCGR